MTDQPKWTPGPWRATTHDHPEQGVYAGYRIAKMTGGEIQRDRANANLIAAAPDLYAALEDLLASYAEPDQQICCGGHGCGCRGASVRDLAEHHARAALAKARGQA